MVLLLLEALGAGLVLVLIVWWTMFSGRKGGELPDAHAQSPGDDPKAADRAAVTADPADRPPGR